MIQKLAAKINLKKVGSAQRRILRAYIFRTKHDILKDILERNKILTVFELYTVELVKELFKQLRLEALMRYFGKLNTPTSSFTARWK